MGVKEASAAYRVTLEPASAEAAVPPGYKQTEVGVIPEDWGVTALGNLCEVTSSKRVFQSDWRAEGVPFYRARELAVLGETGSVDNELFITKEMYERFKRAFGVPAAGDMLVTGVGTLGKTYVVKGDHDFYFKDGNIIWFKVGHHASSDFLNQLYLTPVVTKQINDNSAGTTVGTYTISGAKKTVVPLPPTKAEQEAIAKALSDTEALIESLQQLVAKRRQIKQGAMQSLLTGQQRLPGFGGEWEATMFAAMLRHHSGNSTLIKGKLSELPLAGHFAAYSASGQDVWHHSFEHEGDALVVSAVGSRCGRTFKAHGKWSAIANTHVVWPNSKKVDARFLLLFLDDENFWLKSGSGQPFVLFKQSFARQCMLPSLEEQAAIAAVLSDMDAEIIALEARLAKTRELKQGMMQALLTGRIRLV